MCALRKFPVPKKSEHDGCRRREPDAHHLDVSPQDVEKVELVQFAQDRSLCDCCSWMARTTIIALAMRATGMSKPTVWRWWDRFLV